MASAFARRVQSLLPTLAERTFVALDFETADHGADSACALGIVRVENLRIVASEAWLIRPPRERILFTHVHNITWGMVKDSPDFAGVWAELRHMVEGAEFVAAHNSSFDSRVLSMCCLRANIPPPASPFLCTVHLARHVWNQRPNDLKSVCQRLGIPLNHHHAGSDAEACARIVLAAAERHRPITEFAGIVGGDSPSVGYTALPATETALPFPEEFDDQSHEQGRPHW